MNLLSALPKGVEGGNEMSEEVIAEELRVPFMGDSGALSARL